MDEDALRATPPADPERREIDVEHVLVIDDHPLFCEALSLTLREALGVARVDAASRLETAIERLKAGPRPDAILLDLNLPDVAGLDGLVRLRRMAPDVPAIVVSSMSDSRVITAVMTAGAAGFVPKESAREVFIAAFRTIWQGRTYTPPGYHPPSAQPAERSREDVLALLAELTPQQARILDLVCEGKLNKQIAHDLSIAETTVKAHITAILRKLGAHSRTHAVHIASGASFASILQAGDRRA
jgi:DNA-binding NarL/FixJ family response regulator